ncbi:Tetratricopeptide repeat protein [Stieleria bergensis]|uniref:Tetratricopeptide repeat protein n=1 Tax=Stieleria bergensis TaxID=2528025 RepID=A0A517SP72_9BACT|nr:Tetratricopeptide repeat protein [Planctomycetes bacterium SV_7m_r]
MTFPLVHTTHLAIAYRRLLSTCDSPRFASEVDRHYSPETLARLLCDGDMEQRRAAGIALGILGDASLLEVIGRAMSDQDRGVRMVAEDSFRAIMVRSAAPVHQQRLLRAMHLIDGGNFSAAMPILRTLIAQCPSYAEAHYQLGLCLHATKDYQQAIECYTQCLWRCRYHFTAWQSIGRCEIARKRIPAAIKALSRCITINPHCDNARLQLRTLRRRLRRSDV